MKRELSIPTEEEIAKAISEYSNALTDDIRLKDIQLWMRIDFRQGAQWAINEIIKRNK